MENAFDVIVVGGGHAGTEAALAAARYGARTLLITHQVETLGQMSCNPAIGGIGKSHLVREVDSMGGAMAKATDCAGIHFRVLNSSKGPAVRATRAQTDRSLYRQAIQNILYSQSNLWIIQQPVLDIICRSGKVCGVRTSLADYFSSAVVLTVGTFLRGTILIGDKSFSGGRMGDPASSELAIKLQEYDVKMGRLKTGTPPRIDKRSVDLNRLEKQPPDSEHHQMSLEGDFVAHPKSVPCYVAHTNPQFHKIVRDNLELSAMYSGGGPRSTGPRYCPSIEDKIVRFAAKDSHQVFIEPEGLHSVELYPNGLSNSLPLPVQIAMIRSMDGFENAHIIRPGYAIEYDYFDPTGLKHTLESKACDNLYFAGQINGTTGYEEAAAQGLIAGINAALNVAGKPQWYPARNEAYIGVLIDDLVTNGAQEPYRMFTSRAEYRLSLGEDTADQRLTPIAQELGLIEKSRWEYFQSKLARIANVTDRLKEKTVRQNEISLELKQPINAYELLSRPDCDLSELAALLDIPVDDKAFLHVVMEKKYAGYLRRQQSEINQIKNNAQLKLPVPYDYSNVTGLSSEAIEKLNKIQPTDIAHAERISGINPTTISLLIIHRKKISWSRELVD